MQLRWQNRNRRTGLHEPYTSALSRIAGCRVKGASHSSTPPEHSRFMVRFSEIVPVPAPVGKPIALVASDANLARKTCHTKVVWGVETIAWVGAVALAGPRTRHLCDRVRTLSFHVGVYSDGGDCQGREQEMLRASFDLDFHFTWFSIVLAVVVCLGLPWSTKVFALPEGVVVMASPTPSMCGLPPYGGWSGPVRWPTARYRV